MEVEEGRFVIKVLDMYRAIEDVKRSTRDIRLQEHIYSVFRGFDGNNESDYLSFCRFLIDKQGKFQEQKQYLLKNDGMNSHMPMVDKYRRMLKATANLPDMWHMSADQALQVLEA